ncbi:uncharacterized protein N0V96_009752 [Colletotrichum fioriniae]|uniref:uncharacterized protein n=1 Tax=Colletotrichum fioriniae TaxID=710243 RepID=UPI0032DAD85B|nr:hypothetical protein N0V96_009752 [Colletotrichum fioriniae]
MSVQGPKGGSRGGDDGEDDKDQNRRNTNKNLPKDADWWQAIRIAPRTEEEADANDRTNKFLHEADDQPLDTSYTFDSKQTSRSTDDESETGDKESSSSSTEDNKSKADEAGDKQSLGTPANERPESLDKSNASVICYISYIRLAAGRKPKHIGLHE